LDIHEYYRILRVSEDASLLEIKSAYRLLVKKYHPDRNSEKKNDSEMIKKINIAFEVLSDKNKRKEYDDLCLEIQNLDFNSQRENENEAILKNHNENKEK
jgi:DnaJ-class molecular chaperone